MPRTLAPLVLLAGALAAGADPQPPAAAAKLVARLGSADFAAREAAAKELDALGEAALPRLREAATSPNPEVARRAREIVAKIERRVGNEKALAPTLVELAADGATVSEVMADLSRQSGYNVNFAPTAGSPTTARTEVTLKTGKVPFWEAVVKVCDAADLRVAAAAGFLAPGTDPATVSANPGTATTVVLAPRGDQPRRRAAVYGAVLVEAVEVPAAAATPAAAAVVLQVWPEPKLNWQATAGARIDRAKDAGGQLLAAVASDPGPPPQVTRRGNVVIVQQVGGGVQIVNPNAAVPLPTPAAFTPNARQAVVQLKPGAKPSAELAELAGAVRGTVQTASEPIVALTGLKPGVGAEGTHPVGLELKATLHKRNGTWEAEVEVEYDQAAVQPAGGGGQFPARGRQRGDGNAMLGFRVTDAAGNAFQLSPTGMQDRLVGGNANRLSRRLTFALTRTADKGGDPDGVAFWGSYGKPVEVPFALTAVPLAGGKK